MLKLVSEKVVFRRVKDALRAQGLWLRACPAKANRRVELGRYYTVRVSTGKVDSTNGDLVACAHTMQLLGTHEHMVTTASPHDSLELSSRSISPKGKGSPEREHDSDRAT